MGYNIGYNNTHEFFRALSLLIINKEEPFSISESSNFDDLSLMLDCSRNKVAKVNTVKKLIRILAMLGYNSLHLYMEDTYEMEGYPYFGYMRGRYSKAELKEMDSYAKTFGIELVASIQTLAHLNCALRWNAHRHMLDCDDILLAGDENTYKFIDDMLKNLSGSLTSRKINIGMDEAYMLGFGNYRIKNGIRNQQEIMLEHLNRVYEICKKYGYEPMMWADMFYRIAGDGSYGQNDSTVKLDDKFKIPEGITPVYWDYASMDKSKYDQYISTLKSLNENCGFAGGAWKWSGVVPNNHFSLECSKIALDRVIANDVKKVMLTAWGDDGDECSVFSILPVIAYYASRRYSIEDYKPLLKAVTGVSAETFLLLDEPAFVGGNTKPGLSGFSPFRYALYQDPLCGIFDYHLQVSDNDEYAAVAKLLETGKSNAGEYAYLFDTLAMLCKVLSKKAGLGIKIKEGYDQKNYTALEAIIKNDIKPLIMDICEYRKIMRTQWLTEAKGAGFEAVDIRIAGVAARLETAEMRLRDFIDKKIDVIEELEGDRYAVEPHLNDVSERKPVWAGSWRAVASAGAIW